MKEDLIKQIKEIDDYTKEYWYEMLYGWQNNIQWRLDAPHVGEIYRNIIKTRNDFCDKLRAEIKRIEKFEKFTNCELEKDEKTN